ncbi:UDP-N-acetylmuramoyl-tripeptide--D-alanyl-D-alanine ligase [Nannocystaceae bacterium ST9]
MRWTPESLAAAAKGRLLRSGSRPIATAFLDSRQPRRDALFVPIVAARDGHDFLADAIAGGASAVLVAEGRPLPAGEITIVEVDDTLAALARLARAARGQIAGPVVAITGSNGKTTTRAFIEATLRSALDPVLCTRGNLNNHLGVPLTLLDEPHQPAGAVIELGMSAPGENDQLAAIVEPSVHVITSIALEHLEFMGSIEAIAAAEAEPISRLRAGEGRAPALIVASDEPLLIEHVERADPSVRVIRFGPAGSGAEVEIVAVEVGMPTRARLRIAGVGERTIELRTFGAHNARNAAAAIAVALHLELPLDPVVAAIERVEPVGDRGRVRELGSHLLIADCYNANPGSMTVALDSLARLRATRSGPLLAVLGDMLELGPDELALHAAIGEQAATLGIDGLLGIGPRSASMVAAARAAGLAADALAADRIDDARSWVRDRLAGREAGAVLFKASRGMRLERILEGL